MTSNSQIKNAASRRIANVDDNGLECTKWTETVQELVDASCDLEDADVSTYDLIADLVAKIEELATFVEEMVQVL